MSIKLLAKVWTLKVSGTEREVLNVMCDHADDFGREARPSIAYIAWKVGCDERTVIRHIKKLREKKALLLERPARDHSPNVYRVNLAVYENKEDFVPKGDGYHATRTNERGDILSERGDKLVSPKPSLKPKQKSENPKTNFYECYHEAFGELAESPTTKNQLATEMVEEYPREWVKEAFLRTARAERVKGEIWRQYQRVPYALRLLHEWMLAKRILPEHHTPKRTQQTAPVNGKSWDQMVIYD